MFINAQGKDNEAIPEFCRCVVFIKLRYYETTGKVLLMK
jgi:hypothetical protein